MITYNQIINAIEAIVISHKQLGENHFFFGEPSDYEALKDLNMPHILLQSIPSPASKDSISYKFRLYYMDIIEADLNNLKDVYSDSFQILNDIINLLNYGDYIDEIFLNLDITYNPYQEKFNDLTAGHWVDINIQTARYDNKCVAPTS